MTTTVTRRLAFNTGRAYTREGQRIGCLQIATGEILMCDIDRGLDYWFSDVQFSSAAIMNAYDHNTGRAVPPAGVDYPSFCDLRREAAELARRRGAVMNAAITTR